VFKLFTAFLVARFLAQLGCTFPSTIHIPISSILSYQVEAFLSDTSLQDCCPSLDGLLEPGQRMIRQMQQLFARDLLAEEDQKTLNV
jgi:hypothetical protein